MEKDRSSAAPARRELYSVSEFRRRSGIGKVGASGALQDFQEDTEIGDR